MSVRVGASVINVPAAPRPQTAPALTKPTSRQRRTHLLTQQKHSGNVWADTGGVAACAPRCSAPSAPPPSGPPRAPTPAGSRHRRLTHSAESVVSCCEGAFVKPQIQLRPSMGDTHWDRAVPTRKAQSISTRAKRPVTHLRARYGRGGTNNENNRIRGTLGEFRNWSLKIILDLHGIAG